MNQNPTPLPRSTIGCENINPLISNLNSQKSALLSQINKSSIEPGVFIYLFRISYMWIGPITWLITTIAAHLYSYLFPDKDLIVDEDLLMPILRKKKIDLEV